MELLRAFAGRAARPVIVAALVSTSCLNAYSSNGYLRGKGNDVPGVGAATACPQDVQGAGDTVSLLNLNMVVHKLNLTNASPPVAAAETRSMPLSATAGDVLDTNLALRMLPSMGESTAWARGSHQATVWLQQGDARASSSSAGAVVGYVILVLFAVALLTCCFVGWPFHELRRTAAAVEAQIEALSWKNYVINTRTTLPGCSALNTCCVQIMCPLIYVLLITVTPYYALIATGDEFIFDHDVEYGRNYTNTDIYSAPVRRTVDYLFQPPRAFEKNLDVEDTGYAPLWAPEGLGEDGTPAGACFCRTMAFVGPQAALVSDWFNTTYVAWQQEVVTRYGEESETDLDRAQKECSSDYKGPLFRVFKSEDDVIDVIDDPDYGREFDKNRNPSDPGASKLDRICAMVVLENDPLVERVPAFTVRTNITGYDFFGKIGSKFVSEARMSIDNNREAMFWYLQSGYLSIQEQLQRFIAHNRYGRDDAPEADFVALPSEEYKENEFAEALISKIASNSFTTVVFACNIVTITYFMIRERQSKQKELMRLMGLFDSSLFMSWVLLFAAINFVVALMIASCIFWIMIEQSDFVILFLILYSTAMAITAMGMVFSTLFSNERIGALAAFGILQVSGIVHVALKLNDPNETSETNELSEDIPLSELYFLSILAPVGYIITMDTYLNMDQFGDGCTWGRLYQAFNRYKVGHGLSMLWLSFLLGVTLYAYLEQIMQHDTGIARPWYFPFTASFWRECFGEAQENATEGLADRHADDDETDISALHEPEDSEMQRLMRRENQVIKIRKLRKEYTNAQGHIIPAIDGLNCTMYMNECFCLLGHNGAGKTTTMSVLTGMIDKTSGHVEVFGKRIPDEKMAVRRDMGFCMQHNVLWDVLTVHEHIKLFGALTGLTPEETEARSDEVLDKVELSYKKYAQACALSGGMKRKLNVAMALLGSARILILDEPTAGMDPHTRRQLWGVLKGLRNDRIMCLTTHYMDEADELGDRICIMNRGKSACNGSNNFLKKALGAGYMLNFVKQKEEAPNEPIEIIVKKYCGKEVVRATVVGRELRLRVPFEGAKGFPSLMKELDRDLRRYGLESYGVGVSDLEDVFLKVASGSHSAPSSQPTEGTAISGGSAAPGAQGSSSSSSGGAQAPTGGKKTDTQATFSQQYWALLQRRMRYGWRDSRMFLCQVFMPVVAIVIFLSMQHEFFAQHQLVFDKITLTTAGWNADDDTSYGDTLATVASGDVENSPYEPTTLASSWYDTYPDGVTQVFLNTSLNTDPSLVPNMNYTDAQTLRGETYTFEEAYSQWAFDVREDGHGPHFGGALYSGDRVIIFPNGSAYWAAPTLFNLHFSQWLSNVSLQTETESESRATMLQRSVPVESLEMSSKPLDATRKEKERMSVTSGFTMGMIVILAFAFIPAGIAAYVAGEKETDVKHQLLISGAAKVPYWLSNFTFDFIFGLTSLVGLLLALWYFGEDAWLEYPQWPATVTLLALYVPAASLFAYTNAHFATSGGGALIGVLLVGLIVGIVGYDMSTLLSAFDGTRWWGEALLWTCRFLVPTTCVGKGLSQLASWKEYSDRTDMSPFSGRLVGGADKVDDLWIYNAGDDIFMLAMDVVLYAMLLALLESGIDWTGMMRAIGLGAAFSDHKCPPNKRLPDDDHVLEEKQRVATLDPKEQIVLCDDVYKSYSESVHAVRGITYAIDGGQVFGLLGVNGAGKTTTFKMMCGQIPPSAGLIYVKGHNVKYELDEVRKLIGYCPQYNALLDLLTVREHLELYAQLKGFIAGKDLEKEVNEKIETFDLVNFRESRSCQLSGGNMRKLQTAIAMVGEPPIIFLDEPSAGMDPVARRHMWNVIQDVASRRKDSAVVLTTHSMEEADALCSRIVVQASGQVRCLGTPQQLKEWYGSGLELGVRIESPLASEIEAMAGKWGKSPDDTVTDPDEKKAMVAKFASSPSIREAFAQRQGDAVRVRALAAWCLTQERIENVTKFLKDKCGGSPDTVTILEQHAGAVNYRLVGDKPGKAPLPYGELFGLIEGNSKKLLLADFQLSQGTLERTFNRIAAEDMKRVLAEGGVVEEG